MLRFVCTSLVCGLLLAQQTPPPATPDTQDSRFVVGVEYVSTPAWVYDRDGNTVSGLRPEQFRLFDNKKEQNIQVDVSFTPREDFGDPGPPSHVRSRLSSPRRSST